MLLSKGFSRRKFLVSSLMALPASGIVLSDLTAAQAADLAAPELNEYKPVFFTGDEWKFVMAACDRLIPAGGRGPGALETNVPIFLDQQLHGELGHDIYLQGPFHPEAAPEFGYQISLKPQEIYQRGIKIINQYTQQKFQKNFSELSDADKDAVLTSLQKKEVVFSDFNENMLTSAAFFSELLADTKNGYLADPMYGGNKGMKAWIAIGFPGARASYLEWIKQHNIPYPLGPVSVKGLRA